MSFSRVQPVARYLLSLFLVAGVGSLLVVKGWEAVRRADRRIGITLDISAEGLQVASVTEGLPADRAGMLPGDVLVAMDGEPLTKRADYDIIAESFERGNPVRYQVRRGEETLILRVVPGTEFPFRRFVLEILVVLCYLGLGLLALFQKPGDLRGRLLFLFSAAVAVELALPLNSIGNLYLGIVTLAAYFLLTGIQIGVELHLASVIPEPQPWLRRHPWVAPLFYAAGLGVGATVCVTFLAEVGGWGLFPWTASQAQAALAYVILPLWASGVATLLAVQTLTYPEPRGRHQAGLVLSGVIPWLALVIAGAGLHFALGKPLPEWLQSLEPVILLCYPVAVFVAIFRYHLFDIELVVRRSLIYTALTASLLLLFYAALVTGGAIFSRLLEGGESIWVVAAATLLLGLLFTPLRRSLQAFVDRRFFPERYALRQRLIALAGELPAQGKLPRMGQHLVSRLCSIFSVRSATLFLADPDAGVLVPLAASRDGGGATPDETFLLAADDPGVRVVYRSGRPFSARKLRSEEGLLGQRLQALEASLVVPLLSHRKLIGILFLGEKERGERYAAEELELLNLLAHRVATVFENARLFESATYEGLTGLLRREAILEHLEKELFRAVRYQRPLSVALADLDHFKAINDRYGHLGGDAVLKRVAQTLAAGLRNTDAIGRYGGEEFLIVLPETDVEGAQVVAEKIRQSLEVARYPMDGGSTAQVTVSLGLAGVERYPRDADTTVRQLIAAADRSLYQAKRGGRNRIFPPRVEATRLRGYS